jgi:hypothetical protein
VGDGIDQGETFSPLLWKIYYDPLITVIHNQYKGYTATIPTNPPRLIHTSVMAYMDDSLWIAPNKNALEHIVSTASSFYKLNNIKVNPLKSALITNSTDDNPHILFDNTAIYANKKNEPLKYLGAWFSLEHNHKTVQKLIIAETKTNLKKLQFAKITEKQAVYVINSVIIPRFQYRIQASYLNPAQLTNLTKRCINLIKYKGKLARGIPNTFILCPDIYALNSMQQAQQSTLITSLLRNLNDPEFDASFFKLRL